MLNTFRDYRKFIITLWRFRSQSHSSRFQKVLIVTQKSKTAGFNCFGCGLNLLLQNNIQPEKEFEKSEKMKRNYFMLIGTLFLLLVVCEKEMADQKRCLRFMEKNSKSITILLANSTSKFIDLTGEINLSDNEIEFRLLNENRAFYVIRFHSIDTFSVDGTFCTIRLTELFVPIPGSGK